MLWVQVNAIQIGTYNIFFYKEIDKNYTGCNLYSAELCAYRGMCGN